MPLMPAYWWYLYTKTEVLIDLLTMEKSQDK